MREFPKGIKSVTDWLFIQDASRTDGKGLAGLAYNTSGLAASFQRSGEAEAALTVQTITTIGTYEAPTSSAHIRFREVNSTRRPGWYEIHLHNDWLANGPPNQHALSLHFQGAANMAPVPYMALLKPSNSVYGYVTSASGATAFAGDTALSSADDFHNDMWLVFLSGPCQGVPRKVATYTGATRGFTFAAPGFPTTPGGGDYFEIIGHA